MKYDRPYYMMNEYKQVGESVKAFRDTLIEVICRGRIPVSSKLSKLAVKLDEAVDKFRCEMENEMWRDHGDHEEATTDVFYGESITPVRKFPQRLWNDKTWTPRVGEKVICVCEESDCPELVRGKTYEITKYKHPMFKLAGLGEQEYFGLYFAPLWGIK